MSEFRDDLLVTSFDKKRVIKIILVAVLLITAFAFSTFLFSLLWDSQRPLPSDRLSEAEPVTDIQKFIPPFPYNLSDFLNQFPNLTTDQLSDLIDALGDMFDGDIDDLDLGDYSQALAALMASEIEVFRVYDYNDFTDMTTKLWRYESFDEYTGDGWHSTAAKQQIDFTTYDDYNNYHPGKDLITLKLPLSSNLGINSMVIPSFFPNPYIMEGSVWSNPNYMEYTPNSPILYADSYNCTTMDISFHTEGDVNMSYQMFGSNLPTSAEIDAIAVEPQYTPDPIKSKYLQLNGNPVDVYINNHDDFEFHYNNIASLILSSDNAFIVADKIRNYLQYNFAKITDPSQYNPAPDGYDQIEWFCENEIGYWADFASAFCAFGRALGLATRFVDGFNSFLIEEFYDNIEGRNAFSIKYKNMYNWAEVFIPTDISGNGKWVQMDIYYDNYLGVPPTYANYSLIVNSNFTAGYRGNIANITATLTLDGNPVGGEPINIYDLTTSQFLGTGYTNSIGQTSILVNIDDTQLVGPHAIFAQYSPNVNDTTIYTIYGDIQVNLISVSPQEVNISLDPSVNIQGYVVDPVNSKRVIGATLEFVLLQKGTNNRIGSPPFDSIFSYTDLNGDFDVIINVDSSVPIGQHELRVDFNGSWYFVPYAAGFINASSNRLDLNITRGMIKKVWFYINDIPSQIPDFPIVSRFSTLALKVRVLNEDDTPLSNQIVSFYDYSRGNVFLGSNTTNTSGITSIDYNINNLNTIGPNLVYAKLGIEENYSYFILNEEPTINIFSGPIPTEINRTAMGATNTFFNIEGEMIDPTNNNPIRTAQLQLKLFRGGLDYSSYLIPSSYFYTDFNGYFNINFEVASNTPLGNYSLRLDFNGTIDRSWHPEYSTFFNLPYINTSSSFLNKLKVLTPTSLIFNFWIDGTPYNDYNNPLVYPNDNINLNVYLESGGIPIGDGEWVNFYDTTQEVFIGSAQTLNGFAGFIYNIGSSVVAGPHQIYANWGSNYNYSYFIVNTPISVNLISGPNPTEIMRSGAIQRTFNLQGDVTDLILGTPIKYTLIDVYMFDGPTDVSYYLVLESGSLRLDDTGVFDLTYSVKSSTPEKNYTIRIEFAGIFMYSWPYNLYNEHNFYLGGINNFTDSVNGLSELKVIDPENLDIYLSVEGNPTLPLYNNTNPPETYNFGETAHIQIQIYHVLPKIGNTVFLYDDFNNNPITSYTFVDESGFVQFNISTNSLHAGLIRLRANYHTYSTFNTTYIIINETISISINSDRNVIQRSFHQFDVWGTLQQNGTNLDGLIIGIFLLDNTYSDVTSSYLSINGPQFNLISGGNFQYLDNSIFMNCPQGQYYILIYYTGSINEAGVSLNDYMIPSMSVILPINITAGTLITGNYDTRVVKDDFYQDDDLYVYGYLEWDNGTAMGFMEVNITVRTPLGQILGTALGYTDINGFFNITLLVGNWPSNSEVWVSFIPEDNFNAPEYYYIEFNEVEVFRET